MTNEERQKLCADLRYLPDLVVCGEAATELERLANRVKSLETAAELNLKEAEQLAQRIAELEQRDRDIANDIRALARWI
jgi:hypothetical protein